MTPDLVHEVLVQCDRHPARVALRAGRVELTYGELGRRVRATAAALRAGGLRDADRVLFSVRPRTEGLVLALGVVAAGGSLVLVDPGSTPELFAARVAAAAPTWAATESLLYALSRPGLAGLARRRGILLPDYARLPVRHVHAGLRLPGVPRGSRRARALARGTAAVEVASRPDLEALVVFTSGTTAAPRAVVHTRGSLGAGTALLRQVCAVAPGDVVRTDQMLLGLPALVSGGTWSLPARAPADDVVGFAAGLGDAAVAFLVPADVTALLDAVVAGRVPARGPRTGLVGGAPVTAALLERAARVLPGTRWVGVYGMTEILPVAVVDGAEKVADAAVTGAGDLVGRPLAGVTARLEPVGPDAPDGVGELVLGGSSLMRGYLDGDGTEAVAEHRTGDLARWDDAGRLVLVGRTRDMLIRGTTNIYPGLYEPRLARLPGVGAAFLVGVPRASDGDEQVVLVVVPQGAPPSDGGPPALGPGDDAFVAEVRRRLPEVLDHGAMPDHVLVADRVPVSGRSRKPDRAALAAAAAALLTAGAR
ncbi:class I adenylate-forming enzyme family protein [Actinotalea sp. JY-7876]|uniref:class I adenylate-forming enzyme family protein n=1 Tax=Actinotalea sp. JY-7876 TaxID=2758442 RepID=UPI0015F413E3|nr:class I adenylate-forming enzyme family protein [Actinotalea sp. JY-7876]